MQFKGDADEIEQSLRRRGRHVVYHWTPLSALPSVLTHGILCRDELERRGIAFVGHGYGGYGKEEDFAGHVCVSFHPQKGMMRSETGPTVLIELPCRVVAAEGAFYCPENTAKSEYDFLSASQRTGLEHLDELFEGPGARRLVDWQAEVWVPYGVPVSQFGRVLFRDKEVVTMAMASCRGIELDRETDLTFAVGTSWMFPTPPPPEADDWEDLTF